MAFGSVLQTHCDGRDFSVALAWMGLCHGVCNKILMERQGFKMKELETLELPCCEADRLLDVHGAFEGWLVACGVADLEGTWTGCPRIETIWQHGRDCAVRTVRSPGFGWSDVEPCRHELLLGDLSEYGSIRKDDCAHCLDSGVRAKFEAVLSEVLDGIRSKNGRGSVEK